MGSRSNVNIIDPNEVISNLSVDDNGIPLYEDLTIYAELTAVRKNRTILIDDGVGIRSENVNNAIDINLMGYDQTNKGDYQHTTKWSENYNVNPTQTKYEGFGITNINVLVNSSYVPTVTIDFEDVRGLVLFNEGKDSPYSVLFDFPPPIFSLTLKGFYGKAIKYDLHLTKVNTDFNGENGTFTINATFIARTFAPLTDVLFKYIFITSLMELDGASVNSDPTKPIRNTYEYVKKLETLYEGINELAEATDVYKKIEENNKKIIRINEIKSIINNFWNSTGDLNKNNKNSKIVIYNNSHINIVDPIDSYEIINNTNTFEKILSGAETSNINVDSSHRLYLGFKASPETNSLNDELFDHIISKLKSTSIGIVNSNQISNVKKTIGGEGSVKLPEAYRVLDISSFFISLIKELKIISDELTTLRDDFNNTVNAITIKELGDDGIPKIGNVFKFLCDDIDTFYNKLRDVGVRSELHHNKYKDEILGGSFKNDESLSAFPLYIVEKNIEDSNGCTVKREERRIPPSDIFTEPLPEIEFINEFINKYVTYTAQEKYDKLKKQTDDQGNNKWIPLNPLDSRLNPLNGINYESPYTQNNTKNNPNTIIDRILERFYVFTQYSYSNAFEENKLNVNIINFGSKADAANLLNSMDESDLLGNTRQSISDKAINFSKDISLFYNYLLNEEKAGNISNFSSLPSGDINKEYTTLGGAEQKFYRNPSNENYLSGFVEISKNDIEIKTENSNTIVDEFQNFTAPTLYKSFTNFLGAKNINIDTFSKENIPLFLDNESEFETKFIVEGNIIDKWANVIYKHKSELINIFQEKTEENVLMLISNFGITQGIHKSEFEDYFLIPSIIETPNFLIPYMGGFIKYHTDPIFRANYLNLFTYDSARIGVDVEIITKIVDEKTDLVNKILNLSENDKAFFLDSFNKLYNSEDLNVFYGNVFEFINEFDLSKSIHDLKNELRNSEAIMGFLIGKSNNRYLLSNTDALLTGKNTYTNYSTISELINDPIKKEFVDNYFYSFFKSFNEGLKKKLSDNAKIKMKIESKVDDNDIRTELYYSFKNIYDKWIVGEGKSQKGFPTNEKGKTLFDSFLFVDRAFNDISGISVDGSKQVNGCIISVDQLIDASKDFNINMFTLMSQILSVNNFEFFPLSTFLSFNENDWEDSFRTFTTLEQTAQQSFVCMYIGGTSSILENGNSNFKDDGVISLTEKIPTDFMTTCSNNEQEENSEESNYGKVRAFRVRFGSQAQSVFTDIKFSSREYTETNESLQILSKISDDNSLSTPVPKGQNLFTVYENRAYSATVTMMGNMMIQPTQYFQIENIPLFNGVYIITKVTHSFKPNTSTTTFEGTKILRYPVPFVHDFATSMGLNGSTILSLDGTLNDAPINNPDENGNSNFGDIGGVIYKGMIDLKIRRE